MTSDRTPRDLLLSVLTSIPRYYGNGRPVRASTWNGRAAELAVHVLADNGWLPRPAEPPRWDGPATAVEARGVDVARVVAVVAGRFDVDPVALTGPGQERRVSLPRQIAMYLCRERLGLSFPEIGRLFRRDHSTVMHGVRHVAELITTNPLTQSQLDACRRDLMTDNTPEPAEVTR